MTSQNEKDVENHLSPQMGEIPHDHSEIIHGMIELIPENQMIKSTMRYSRSKTKPYLVISIVLSLFIMMIFFGVLYAVVDKEIIESLNDFIRYSLTILNNLTGTVIGYYFGRAKKTESRKKPF